MQPISVASALTSTNSAILSTKVTAAPWGCRERSGLRRLQEYRGKQMRVRERRGERGKRMMTDSREREREKNTVQLTEDRK